MANKFAIGVALYGAMVVIIPVTQRIQENAYRPTPAPMTNREFEKLLTDAAEINRQTFAQQKAEDEKTQQSEASQESKDYAAELAAQVEFERALGLYRAEAARQEHGW